MAEDKKAVAKKKRPTALKRDIQNAKKCVHNKAFKSKVRTALRSFEDAVTKKQPSKESLDLVYSLMDKGVKTGIFKQNKANRVKSRLTKRAFAATA